MTSLTKQERRAVARRVYAALCAHYPERYVALVEQPGPNPTATTIVDCSMADDPAVAPTSFSEFAAGERATQRQRRRLVAPYEASTPQVALAEANRVAAQIDVLLRDRQCFAA
jgi:hypothetical protein